MTTRWAIDEETSPSGLETQSCLLGEHPAPPRFPLPAETADPLPVTTGIRPYAPLLAEFARFCQSSLSKQED